MHFFKEKKEELVGDGWTSSMKVRKKCAVEADRGQ